MAQLDPETIRHALEVARTRGMTTVELTCGDTSFQATLAPAPPRAAVSAASGTTVETEEVRAIVAPLVGYFQKGPAELKIGQPVSKGSVVGIVSALGLANDIEAPCDGEILEVFVDDNDPVQFGQRLATLRVAP